MHIFLPAITRTLIFFFFFHFASLRRCERISCFNYLDCQNTPVRITYYQLNFQTNIMVPAHIFRIGPSPAYAGDNIILTINKGNEENYFSTRRLNSYTGIVYLQRQVKEPKDFLLDVEMKLWRQGTYTTFLAKIYIFITAHAYWSMYWHWNLLVLCSLPVLPKLNTVELAFNVSSLYIIFLSLL